MNYIATYWKYMNLLQGNWTLLGILKTTLTRIRWCLHSVNCMTSTEINYQNNSSSHLVKTLIHLNGSRSKSLYTSKNVFKSIWAVWNTKRSIIMTLNYILWLLLHNPLINKGISSIIMADSKEAKIKILNPNTTCPYLP